MDFEGRNCGLRTALQKTEPTTVTKNVDWLFEPLWKKKMGDHPQVLQTVDPCEECFEHWGMRK